MHLVCLWEVLEVGGGGLTIIFLSDGVMVWQKGSDGNIMANTVYTKQELTYSSDGGLNVSTSLKNYLYTQNYDFFRVV